MTNWLPPHLDGSDAWWTVGAALALYAGRKLLDALLPKGWVFRFASRYMNRLDKEQETDDE